MCYLYTLQYLLFKAKIRPQIVVHVVKWKSVFLSRTTGEFQEHFTILEEQNQSQEHQRAL